VSNILWASAGTFLNSNPLRKNFSYSNLQGCMVSTRRRRVRTPIFRKFSLFLSKICLLRQSTNVVKWKKWFHISSRFEILQTHHLLEKNYFALPYFFLFAIFFLLWHILNSQKSNIFAASNAGDRLFKFFSQLYE
jgi:hypothetical protein